MDEEDKNETNSSYSSSSETESCSVILSEDEIEKLIQLFKKDINRNCGIFITLKDRKSKKSVTNIQSVNNKDCHIKKQNNNNINLTVNKNKIVEVPFDIPKFTNPFFGRQTQTKRIDKLLDQSNLAILTGIEGIGKTELAKSYIEKHYKKFDGNIEWINASSEDNFRHSISYICDKHCLNDSCQDFVKYFQNKNTLFVVDNAYNKIQYRQYFPRSNSVSVLMTTEYPDMTNKKSMIELSSLTDDETIDVFQSIFTDCYSQTDEYDWLKFGAYFEKIPLALHIISSCLYQEMLQDNSLRVETYLQGLQQKEHLILENPLGDEYKMIYVSFRVCLDTIKSSEKEHQLALEILNICVYLNHAFISKQVLLAHNNLKNCKLNEIVNILKKYNLIYIGIKQNSNEIYIPNIILRTLLEQQKKDGTSKKYFKMALGLLSTLGASLGVYNMNSILNFATSFVKLFTEFILQNNLLDMLIDLIIENGHNDILNHILKVCPNTEAIMEENDLLLKAIKYEQPKIVKVLVRNNADVNKLTAKQRCPLHKASKKGSLAIILILLNAGADASVQDYKNNNPLHTLVGMGYQHTKNEEKTIQCARALIKHGADVNAENIEGYIPLDFALENKAFRLALFLLKQMQVNLTIYHKQTMKSIFSWELTEKEENNALKVIRTLLLRGANKYEIDQEGRSLLHWAIDNKSQKIVSFLLKDCCLNVNHQDNKGFTALHKTLNQSISTKKDAQIITSIVRILVAQKANTTIKDNDGVTAYDISQKRGNIKLCLFVQFLNYDLPQKKKNVFYLPNKQHRKPQKRSSNRPPFWSSTGPYRQIEYEYPSTINTPGLLEYGGLNNMMRLNSPSSIMSPPPALPGPSYCNNLLR